MLPDERRIGGREEVEAELRNMHKKILNARSTLQTRLDRQYRSQTNKPRPASAKSLTDRREEAKQREASKRRMEQASRSSRRSFSGPPKSLHMATQLSENRRRRQRVTDRSQYEHERELHHLSRRMKEQCSLTSWRKESPVYLRRNELRPPLTLESVTGAGRKKAPEAAARGPRGSRRVVDRPPPAGGARPASARAAAVPSTSAENERMYESFREMLLDEILAKSLHDEEGLQGLFVSALEENPRTRHARFQGVLERVVLDLCDYLMCEAPDAI